jgi:hypothetical protein
VTTPVKPANPASRTGIIIVGGKPVRVTKPQSAGAAGVARH